MPLISEFLGIRIYMYYNDHYPPHFHVRGSGYSALVAVENGKVIKGNLPDNTARAIKKWAGIHTNELKANWVKAQKGQVLSKINPLV